MSLLEVDGNAIATLVCEPASLALPPVLRVNVGDGYERDKQEGGKIERTVLPRAQRRGRPRAARGLLLGGSREAKAAKSPRQSCRAAAKR